jgi:hypothetical protein
MLAQEKNQSPIRPSKTFDANPPRQEFRKVIKESQRKAYRPEVSNKSDSKPSIERKKRLMSPVEIAIRTLRQSVTGNIDRLLS